MVVFEQASRFLFEHLIVPEKSLRVLVDISIGWDLKNGHRSPAPQIPTPHPAEVPLMTCGDFLRGAQGSLVLGRVETQ